MGGRDATVFPGKRGAGAVLPNFKPLASRGARMLAPFVALLVLPGLPGDLVPSDVPLPGGRCDGVVDVLCEDWSEACDQGPTQCWEVHVRDCVVWITYLDMTTPEGWDSLSPTFCEDQPYYP